MTENNYYYAVSSRSRYAVYIPLFLPVMIPVIMSLKNIHAWFFGRISSKSKLKED